MANRSQESAARVCKEFGIEQAGNLSVEYPAMQPHDAFCRWRQRRTEGSTVRGENELEQLDIFRVSSGSVH